MKHLLPTVPESTANQKEEEECQNASRARMPGIICHENIVLLRTSWPASISSSLCLALVALYYLVLLPGNKNE